MGRPLGWETLEVASEERMTWRKAAVRIKGPMMDWMTDWLWGPKERGDSITGLQT